MANGLDMLDKLQEAVINNGSKKESEPQYHFDKLKMYFGEDFNHKGITISMPTIGDILEIGESNFYQALSPFIYNSTSIRVMLWDNGMDWNDIKDIEVFNIMSTILRNKEREKEQENALDTVEENTSKFFKKKKKKDVDTDAIETKTVQSIMFNNINFNDFILVSARETIDSEPKPALFNEKEDILLYENDYMIIAEYIREILNMHPKVEKAKGKTAKSWIIQEEKMDMLNKENKSESTLLPLISTCVNHPGFKYKLQELREVGLYQFMDSVKRIQKYENGTAALKGKIGRAHV